MTHDDMLQYGYEYEDGVYSLPSGIIPPEAYMPSILLLDEPKYPKFDPRNLPWTSAPSYIQDIIYMGLEGASVSDDSQYKMPFIAVRVNGSRADVYVGINCFLGSGGSSGNVRICSPVGAFPSVNSYCYYATFSHNYEVRTDWTKCSSVAWGDTGKLFAYTASTFFSPTSTYDLYLYGGNGVRSGSYTSVTIAATSSTNVVSYTDNYLGFTSGRYFVNPGDYTNLYVSTFVPPTPEEVEQETQKGIFDTLKSIPDTIADKFKGLFIPEEGYFDTYIQEYQDYFSERFGLLYEIPDSIADIFQQLIEFNPAEEGYYIDFPEVVMPVLENGEWRDVVLIEDTKVTFDFLDEGPIATLYSMYRAALWLLFIFLLINLIIRKSDKVFGGGSG